MSMTYDYLEFQIWTKHFRQGIYGVQHAQNDNDSC